MIFVWDCVSKSLWRVFWDAKEMCLRHRRQYGVDYRVAGSQDEVSHVRRLPQWLAQECLWCLTSRTKVKNDLLPLLFFLWVSWNIPTNVEKNIAEFWGELFLPRYPITQSASLRPQRSSRKLIWLRRQLMFSNSCHVFGRERCWWMGDVGGIDSYLKMASQWETWGGVEWGRLSMHFWTAVVKETHIEGVAFHIEYCRFRFLCDKDALFNVISGLRTEDIVYITIITKASR